MNETPKGNRIHIAIFGKRNVGKSSFMNALLGQPMSIVSATPGTTTDPVEKAYELQPVGPVMFIDTAGLDDEGELGNQRIKQTEIVINKTDIAILMIEHTSDGVFEKNLMNKLSELKIPTILVLNKIDLVSDEELKNIINVYNNQNATIYPISVMLNKGIEEAKKALIKHIENKQPDPPIIMDLIKPGENVVLVIPIDKEAPKGRLILPQVQTIRECLDADISCTVVKEKELHHTLTHVLKQKPKLVITDSQAFLKADADTPSDIMLTSFSILFARQKGDLNTYIKGVKHVNKLKNGDKILVAELCSHKPITEDIGRVKIPRWLRQHTGLNLIFDFAVGAKPTFNPNDYALIIQCGGCMVTRTLIMNRINDLQKSEIPVTNYGVLIAYMHGILKRALTPFPSALMEFENESN